MQSGAVITLLIARGGGGGWKGVPPLYTHVCPKTLNRNPEPSECQPGRNLNLPSKPVGRNSPYSSGLLEGPHIPYSSGGCKREAPGTGFRFRPPCAFHLVRQKDGFGIP